MNINSKKGGWGEGRGGPLAMLKSALDHLMDGKFLLKFHYYYFFIDNKLTWKVHYITF